MKWPSGCRIETHGRAADVRAGGGAAGDGPSLSKGSVRAMVTGIICCALGYGAASLGFGRHSHDQAYVAGACMALEATTELGVLDDSARYRVVRTLTSVLNPYADKFPDSPSRMLRTCQDVRQRRYPGALGGS